MADNHNPTSGAGSKDLSASMDGGSGAYDRLVVCFGEMLIDFVPTVGGVSLAEAPAFKKAPGGDDEFGYMLANILKENNVDTSGVRYDSTARTALAFVTLRADGEREFLFFRHPSADMLLCESELDKNLIKQGSIFHYGSISLIAEPCRSTQLAAMNLAKESGSILSYDPNLRLPLWPSEEAAREGIMSIWDQADIIKVKFETRYSCIQKMLPHWYRYSSGFFMHYKRIYYISSDSFVVSDDEITFLTGGDDHNDDNVVLEKLFHPNLKLLIVTEGSKGCRYYTKEFKGRVPGVKTKAVDTTGAGDSFVSGILNCLAADQNLIKDENRLREALLFANACGALTVTERGAIPALPTKEAALKLLHTVAAFKVGFQLVCRSEWNH
ncbi:hypothetical protein CUMW_058240 [Citrus unshiu]|nr:hypothetical protein CUMW_058240 [Citrus unshiu]